jgi:hypothetical protein
MRLAARLAGVDIISRTGGDIMDHNAHQPGCFPKAAEGAILMMTTLGVARLAQSIAPHAQSHSIGKQQQRQVAIGPQKQGQVPIGPQKQRQQVIGAQQDRIGTQRRGQRFLTLSVRLAVLASC